ncbi:MAG: hypothetical protein KAR19_19780 [Bacteroidales bacterium]|nr:hypothetical protein [Bacteroidales bacterium]
MASIGESVFVFMTTGGQINELTKLYRTTISQMIKTDNPDYIKYEYILRSQLIIQIRIFWEEYYNLREKKIQFEDDPLIEAKVTSFIELINPIFKDLNNRWPKLREVRNMFYAHGYRNDDLIFVATDFKKLETLVGNMLSTNDWVYIAICFYAIAELCKSIFRQ